MHGNVAKRSNGMWRARYRDASHREHARHFVRKIDAERWLQAVAISVAEGSYADPRAGRLTVGEWIGPWLESRVDLKATTRATYGALLSKHIEPRWGAVALSDVRYEDVRAWVHQLDATGLSASTVRQVFRVLSLALDAAVQSRRLQRNPAVGVPLPKRRESEKSYLTHVEVGRLAEAAGRYRLLIFFLAYTGVRFGEAAALRVGRLDLERRRARIAEGVAEVRGASVFDSPKTHRKRMVPIPRFLADELVSEVDGRRSVDFVFPAPQGGVLRLRNWRRAVFDPAAKAAGLPGLGHVPRRGV